jgi:hypothetical protein
MGGDVYRRFCAAAVQAAPVFLERDASISRLEQWAAKAKAAGADLIVFGESYAWLHYATVAWETFGIHFGRDPMDKVSVYFFEGWDGPAGENKKSLRMATLEAIKGKGTPILETQRTVDKSDLDGSGFYPKPKVWLVKIFDLVSRVEGRSRVSVPHGEYAMREISTELYSLSGDLLPMPFELSLLEVATYLPGENKPGKMKIIAGEPF